MLRKLVTVADEIAATAFNPQGKEARQLLDEAESKVFKIAQEGAKASAGFREIQPLLSEVVDKIEIFDVNDDIPSNFVVQSAVESLENKYPNNIHLMEEDTMKKEFLASQDIMIISLESWKSLVDSQSDWLSGVPSVLILKP